MSDIVPSTTDGFSIVSLFYKSVKGHFLDAARRERCLTSKNVFEVELIGEWISSFWESELVCRVSM